jgi:hypothetical protein
VTLEAAPYAVRGILDVGEGGGAPWLLLSDGSREPLDPATLALGDDGVLRCEVKGDHAARFTRAAQIALGLALEESPPGSGRYSLVVGGVAYPVRSG